MQFIFFREGITASLIPIYTLIEHQPNNIVGCILIGHNQLGEMPPDWFLSAYSHENTALELLSHVKMGETLGGLHVFLVVKEPNSLLQLTVLACTYCCSFNCSGEGGRGGRKLLELLAKHNIPTYPAEIIAPVFPNRTIGHRDYRDKQDKKECEYFQVMENACLDAFTLVARDWLPNTWGFDPVTH